MSRPWSLLEVEATVADYLDMLSDEMAGRPLNKAEHRRRLAERLDDRSHAAIERKHQNISAVLIELGCPYVFGYKPLGNYQSLLFDVVADRLTARPALGESILDAVQRPASAPSLAGVLERLVDAPKLKSAVVTAREPEVWDWKRRSRRFDYLEREARNASLGRAGEEFVLTFERERLRRLGRESLADRIRHVAVEDGDGAGFDVLSFEESGRDRYIEVKTTAYDDQTPFYVTRNELRASQELRESYHLYRVFKFRSDPRLYGLIGALDLSARLTPIEFSGLPA